MPRSARNAGLVSEGAYLLRSNIVDWNEQQLWKAYIQLTQARGRLSHPEGSAEGASHLAPERRARPSAYPGLLSRFRIVEKPRDVAATRRPRQLHPRTVLEELARIQANDVILPTATHGEIRLRCITQPDAAQAALLDRIALPKRMRLKELDRLPISA
jgi:hypothetical protein